MAADASSPSSVRERAQRHIEEHALGEAARIARMSRIREFVLGCQDGLLVPLGVVTGMAAANPGRGPIMVAGLAEAVAGCIAMGGGSYLASEAEEALYAAEIESEGREIEDDPEREVAELALVLEQEGLPPADAERVAHGLAANPRVFLRTKIQKELGLSPDVGGAALGDALIVGAAYLIAAIIPLWPYAFLPLIRTALVVSLACTFAALFALGVVKARVAGQARVRGGLQVLLIGSASAGVGFVIGHVVTAFT
jgi:VIT1/CCC1 family predicted Fe2+/Mn2+ transporter